MAEADIASKQTISMYNRAWAEWILQEQQIEVEAELSGEFQFVARTSDSLLQVQAQNRRFLVLTEIQWSYDARMPHRLAAYAALARHKYQQEVFVTVVYLLSPPDSVTLQSAFHTDFMGQIGHQDFQVIGLWSLNAREVLSFDNPALLPFVPLMQGGNTEQVLRQCAARLRQEPRAPELETILALFAGYVMDTRFINRILRWDMDLNPMQEFLLESPLAKEIMEQLKRETVERARRETVEQVRRETVEQVRQETIEQVRRETVEQVRQETIEQVRRETVEQVQLEARHEEALEWLNRTLTLRFDVGPIYLKEKAFERYELDTLEKLGEMAITAQTLAEFEAFLETVG